MTLDDIQQAIAKLSPDELVRLRAWLAQYEAARSEQTAEPETQASKFGRLAGRAIADVRKRLRET